MNHLRFSGFQRAALAAFATLFLGVSLAACGSGSGSSASGPVEWPQLRALDDLSHRAKALLQKDDIKGLRELAPELAESASAVANAQAPKGVKSAGRVSSAQGDLKGLAKTLAKADLPDADLRDAAAATHALVEQLMEASGLPHVHAHHDHDEEGHEGHAHHDDHDHDHGAEKENASEAGHGHEEEAHEGHDHDHDSHEGHGH